MTEQLTTINGSQIISVREWCGYTLATVVQYGTAARGNRGRHAGSKIHRLLCEYVIAVTGDDHRPGTAGRTFQRYGKPVLFSVHPTCGCTRGQVAGQPYPGLGEEKVTCTKCSPNYAATRTAIGDDPDEL